MCGLPSYAQRTHSVDHPLLPNITNARLDNFFSNPYISQNLDKYLDRARYDGEEQVKMRYWSPSAGEKPSFKEAASQFEDQSQPLKKGHIFGPSWSNHWIWVDISVPSELREAEQPVIFEFDPGCEGLFFTPEGVPLHAITGGANTNKDGKPGVQEDRRVEHIIPPDSLRSGKYSLVIEITCNRMFGMGAGGVRYLPPDPNRTFPLMAADIVLPHLDVRGLRTDFRILSQIARHPASQGSGLGQRALRACDSIMNHYRILEDLTPEGFDERIKECRKKAWEVYGDLDQEGLRRLCLWSNDKDADAQIWTIGHCHIDTAWLWRYTQTQQKVARSWTTQCDLMDRWPGYQFAASSAQQYAWLEELYPQGFERVATYISSKRFHAVGGAWVEHDCMLPSGESLARQYVYGQRYFKSRFGQVCKEAWLPDTFGYASQLPQILRLAGLKYFFTQKLSWNNINLFPYSTFNWAGIDGSQVFSHMTPVDSYNGQADFDEIIKSVRDNKNLGVTDECLYLIGNGDGGGGPNPAMLEKLERLSAVSERNPDVPSIKTGSPIDFFENLLHKTEGGKVLPTWRGELYLELHRGTYTTQADIKKGNREMEQTLQALEYFATQASLVKDTYEYPKSQIDEIWKDILLAQFHDCLPGSTIKTVVEDNIEIYTRRGRQARNLIEKALEALGTSISTGNGAHKRFLDPLRLDRNHVSRAPTGELVWLESASDNGVGTVKHTAPEGFTRPEARRDGAKFILENGHCTCTVSDGRITSLVDRRNGRELITRGPGANTGGFNLYEDIPLAWDAWDIELYHLQAFRELVLEDMKITETKEELRATMTGRIKFGKSHGTIKISLDAVDPHHDGGALDAIRFEVDLEWREKHKALKFVLPVDIQAPDAVYGTQFGTVKRPTHRNTKWDQAKFEVCGHGFGDLSESNYGVTICSNHKYGYAVEGNTMRLSLLRSPTTPDDQADMGRHAFSFGVIPHIGGFIQSGVAAQAARFNNLVQFVTEELDDDLPLPSFRVTGDPAIILETVKRGEDDIPMSKSVILRLYESHGGRSVGRLSIRNVKVKSATWVNLLEDPLEEGETNVSMQSSADGFDIALNMGCFEIKTVKLDVE